MAVSIAGDCEERFGVELELLEVSAENFSSTDVLTELVLRNRKRSAIQ